MKVRVLELGLDPNRQYKVGDYDAGQYLIDQSLWGQKVAKMENGSWVAYLEPLADYNPESYFPNGSFEVGVNDTSSLSNEKVDYTNTYRRGQVLGTRTYVMYSQGLNRFVEAYAVDVNFMPSADINYVAPVIWGTSAQFLPGWGMMITEANDSPSDYVYRGIPSDLYKYISYGSVIDLLIMSDFSLKDGYQYDLYIMPDVLYISLSELHALCGTNVVELLDGEDPKGLVYAMKIRKPRK